MVCERPPHVWPLGTAVAENRQPGVSKETSMSGGLGGGVGIRLPAGACAGEQEGQGRREAKGSHGGQTSIAGGWFPYDSRLEPPGG